MEKDRADALGQPAAPARDVGLRQALAAARETIERLRGEADAAKQVKADFMARMTHEMRTPLSAIIGLANLALPLAGDPKLIDYLDKILASARGLLGVVDDITDFSRLEKGLVDLAPAPFDLEEAVTRVTQRFAQAARAKGLVLASRLAPGLVLRLVGDQARLEGVLSHLVGNAVKFTESGRVDLIVTPCWRRGGAVRLRFAVRDTGIGMDRATIPDMLESFTQADGSLSRPYGGTGLGLALVRRGAVLLGGALEVQSEPGHGTIFSFEATFDEDADGAQAPLPGPAEETPADVMAGAMQHPPLSGVLLLLVEDNAINQQVAREMLVRLGATVDVAGHGREAVDMVGRAFYDAVLMDVQMPVMDGLEATKAIRALPGGADVPVIALTAHALAEDRDRCLAAGMNDYLTKPIDTGRLLATLGQWIATAAGAARPAPGPLPPLLPGTAQGAPAGIDAAKALARLGGNERLLHSVAAEFARDYAGSATEILGLARSGDMESARRLAHTVKGVAGNIAADVLAVAARDLEAALGAGNLPEGERLEAYDRALRATVADADRLAPAGEAIPACPQGKCLHVLLVDDAKLNRAVFGQILRGAGHNVTTAENGKEACRLLFGERPAARPFDCILMDIEMPVMDGPTASRVIRGLLSASANPPCARDIPIVALTSHDVDEERDRCLAAGMDACLPKIFEREVLLDALAQVLRLRGDTPRRGGSRRIAGQAGQGLAPILRGLCEHLRAGSVRADEDLLALRQALADKPEPPELEALVAAVERYAFAEALGLVPGLARRLGLEADDWGRPREGEDRCD
ncbi:MAG: response regulator [Solidesulfovibrio sp. DCME]|uniref:response regulator n=1 Tax=Solidesulfovibrio sp. DCME TaxID=3447380 RepID=UPI003D09F7ED